MQSRESIPVIRANALPLIAPAGVSAVRYLRHQSRQFTLRGLSARSDPARSAARRYTPSGPVLMARPSSQPMNTIQT
jgi:hypothetical protein